MARSTRYGGASQTAEELADPSPPIKPVKIRRAEIGYVDRTEDQSSHGKSGSPSSASAERSSAMSKASPPLPAPTTENPSAVQDEEAGSTALSTGTAGRRTRRRAVQADTDDFDFD